MLSPTIILHYPKHLSNLAAIARIAACHETGDVWFTGNRVDFDVERLPRELRMQIYASHRPARLHNIQRALGGPGTPVAVEIVPGAETLPLFRHPEDAIYVFGPEDGSLPPAVLKCCFRFVQIPTKHCLSLPAAVATVLYDRKCKESLA